MRGAWTAVRRIVVPVAGKTASKEPVKFDPRSRIRNLLRHEVARCECAYRGGRLDSGDVPTGLCSPVPLPNTSSVHLMPPVDTHVAVARVVRVCVSKAWRIGQDA